MPNLVGFIDPAEDAPGFLLPLFQYKLGSNILFVQVISQDNLVSSFTEVAAPSRLFRRVQQDQNESVSVGDPALWVFKDQDGTCHVGDSHVMTKIAIDLITGPDLSAWPLTQLELDSFCNPSRPNAKYLRAAFDSIVDSSGNTSAQIWRDTEVFAPAVRRDIYQHGLHSETPILTNSVMAMYRKQLVVFVSKKDQTASELIAWGDTKYALRCFGLEEKIVVRSLKEVDEYKTKQPTWSIIGVGGVARFVLEKRPFNGKLFSLRDGQFGMGVEAVGNLGNLNKQHHFLSHSDSLSQFVAVCQSIEGQVELMAAESSAVTPEFFVRHLVNVRPFSFGSPPPRKTMVDQLPLLGRGFDHVWLIAGQRQRRTGNYRNQLSVTNAASRLVRSLLLSLVYRSDLVSQITREGLSSIPSINLFGSIRRFADWSEQEVLRNLLHSMLCEEALLHTAEKIVVISQREMLTRTVNVQLGARNYSIEVVPGLDDGRTSDLVGWAYSVRLPKKTAEEFSDFCVSILAGYRWRYRGVDGDMMLFEDEGEVLAVFPAYDKSTLDRLILEGRRHRSERDLLLTPVTVSAKLRRLAAEAGWSLLHYSELPIWLRENFGSYRFGHEPDL